MARRFVERDDELEADGAELDRIVTPPRAHVHVVQRITPPWSRSWSLREVRTANPVLREQDETPK